MRRGNRTIEWKPVPYLKETHVTGDDFIFSFSDITTFHHCQRSFKASIFSIKSITSDKNENNSILQSRLYNLLFDLKLQRCYYFS